MSHPENDKFRENLEEYLDELPDLVAEAQKKWELATLKRQEIEAGIYVSKKMLEPNMSPTELKMEVQGSQGRHQAAVDEIEAKTEYTRLYERLMCMKKRASLRTAY